MNTKMKKSFVVRTLLKEANMKPGDNVSFKHDNYELTLIRENALSSPFYFAVKGKGVFPTHQVQVGWRYTSMEKAFLHILNHFNENANIRDKYKSLDQRQIATL